MLRSTTAHRRRFTASGVLYAYGLYISSYTVSSFSSIASAVFMLQEALKEMSDLWKYCTAEQCRQFLLSLDLVGTREWPDDKKIACLYAVSNHVEKHYHKAVIKKRNGKERHLLVPDPLLKGIQRQILHNVLEERAISRYATAYHKGAKLRDNAVPHVGKEKILKLDIENFFENILFKQVLQSAFPKKYFPPSIGTLLTYLCCYYDYLPQGAPTSPAISNLVMRSFDESMGEWCREREISYSRYCDDLTFSGDFDAEMVKRKAGAFLDQMGFRLNQKKTRVISRNQQQNVTGVVVNCKPQVSKEYRRKLRQEIYYCRKYGIRAHLERIGDKKYLELGDAGIERYRLRLIGKVNYVRQVNPVSVPGNYNIFTENL